MAARDEGPVEAARDGLAGAEEGKAGSVGFEEGDDQRKCEDGHGWLAGLPRV